MVQDLPSVIKGSKFTFLQTDEGTIPNNCPLVTDKNGNPVNSDDNVKPATKEFKTLGLFPVTILFQRGFAEDPRFEWKKYWEQQCSKDGNVSKIDVDELLSDFDKMQKNRLGNLVTGATTLTGNIGQKAIRDGNMDLATKTFDQLMNFAGYIETGIKKKSFPETEKYKKNACDGDRRLYCDDALARTYLGVGRMAVAAVQSGLAKDESGDPITISSNLIKRKITPEKLGDPPSMDEFKASPYKASMETLLHCMIDSKDGSLKRDICTEMIKDVTVAGIMAKEEQVYTDGINHLSGYYDKDFFAGKKDTWDNMKTWVNSTVWMADGLIKLMEAQDAGLLKDDTGVNMLIKAIAKQRKEGLMEFSTADWITQQALIISAKKGRDGIFKNHDKLIGGLEIVENGKMKKYPGIEERLSVWNPWLELYTNAFKSCSPENPDCMTSDTNKAMRQLAISINNGCLAPIAKKLKKGNDLDDLDKQAIENCTKATSDIIKKAGNENVLGAATETYFLYGQEDGGVQYIPDVEKNIKEAINERFVPGFIRRMDGLLPRDKEKRGAMLIQPYNTTMFNRRFERPATKKETRVLNDVLKRSEPSTFSMHRNYLIETTGTEKETKTTTKLLKDEASPLFILEQSRVASKFLPRKIVAQFEKEIKK